MRYLSLCGVAVILVVAATLLYRYDASVSGYYGLPAVPCVDPTQPLRQNFSLQLRVTVAGQAYPLTAAIGHDPGQCLRAIHSDDASGVIHVQANSATETYTLGELFNVWHKDFGANSFLGKPLANGHGLAITVNGAPVATGAATPLAADETIAIVYR